MIIFLALHVNKKYNFLGLFLSAYLKTGESMNPGKRKVLLINFVSCVTRPASGSQLRSYNP